MDEKVKDVRQRFFMAKELRLSIALIVIWSLLAGILFTYLAKELGARLEHGVFSFIAVFLGYVVIVVVLALFFTHRFIGPFERLKIEMRLILTGNYHRRLNIRKNDDLYIKSFITDVNKILDGLERRCIDKERVRKEIDPKLLNIVSLVEKDDIPRERLREAVLSLHEKIESLFKENDKVA